MNKKIKGEILAVCQKQRERNSKKRHRFRSINRKLWPGK